MRLFHLIANAYLQRALVVARHAVAGSAQRALALEALFIGVTEDVDSAAHGHAARLPAGGPPKIHPPCRLVVKVFGAPHGRVAALVLVLKHLPSIKQQSITGPSISSVLLWLKHLPSIRQQRNWPKHQQLIIAAETGSFIILRDAFARMEATLNALFVTACCNWLSYERLLLNAQMLTM